MRPNKGVNPRYNKEIYLGLTSSITPSNQNEGSEAKPRPFSLLP